jgi:hypothetical protein
MKLILGLKIIVYIFYISLEYKEIYFTCKHFVNTE